MLTQGKSPRTSRTASPAQPPLPAFRQGIVIFAKNRKRVSTFYQRALGLAVAVSDSAHDRLIGDGCEVVVHSIPNAYADAIRIPRPVVPREDAAMKPVFLVPSLAAVRAAIKRTGGQLLGDDRCWQYESFAVLDGWDPEGNVVQFKEPRSG